MAPMFMILMVLVIIIIQEILAQEGSSAMPGCQEKCGNVTIPYPFGMNSNCSGNHNFLVTCNTSFDPPRPFLGNMSLEVLEIMIYAGTMHVKNPFLTSNCQIGVNSSLRQFTFSDEEQFVMVLDWSTYWSCNLLTKSNISSNVSLPLCGRMASCSSDGLCECVDGYAGNPYMIDGCQDIDECSPAKYNGTVRTSYGTKTVYNLCSQICINKPGSYSCSCYYGNELSTDGYRCNPFNKTLMAIVGICSSLAALAIIVGTWWLYKVTVVRERKKLTQKFFKKNGGLLLQQQVSSSEGNVEKSKLFTSKELAKATDNYNMDRIIGQGGQGTVYKGMLTDGSIVAVKKSKKMDQHRVEHFINEVVILSLINHRNIVKLYGCCLETEVPLLVYEFIPNGTLYEYIHEEQRERFPLSWDMRLRVATEVAGALFYLHSAASMPIYHRDIKSTNILLDAKYRAKIADFGTSRSISVDQTHLTTKVQGTFGYLDPQYFRSSQFTEKSDVYSFGVVLVELLTGLEPIISDGSDDEQSLAAVFMLAMEENRLFDILDVQVMEDAEEEDIKSFANLANRCLYLNGRNRPTMKQVAVELEGIRTLQGGPIVEKSIAESAYSQLHMHWDTNSTRSSGNRVSFDVETLIYSK